jgi:SecD/SecF fusion protein
VSDYFERIERQLVERVTAPSRRARLIGLASGWLVPAVAVLVAVAVAAVFFVAGAPRGTRLSPGSGGTDLAYVARPANPSVPLQASLGIAVARLRGRLATVRPAVTVARQGDLVTLRGVTPATRATVEALARPGHLVFYDWEANALTPSGRTVASRLTAQEPLAATISQGAAGGAGPGAGGGGLSLYRAVTLASRQPVVTAGGNARLSRIGPLYYLFGAPGSRACAAVASLTGSGVAPGEHCLLAGPDTSAGALRSDLPAGVSASAAEQLVVPQGTVVLQASGATAGQPRAPSRPTARFYVLRDQGALSGGALTHPRESTDQSGSPDVSFGFTASGEKQFQRATAGIAQRGAVDSRVGGANQLNQHFAVALDQQLLSVPSIDFKIYPDGITGGGGADISGGFTRHSAHELATILRTGPLPVDLIPIGQP